MDYASNFIPIVCKNVTKEIIICSPIKVIHGVTIILFFLKTFTIKNNNAISAVGFQTSNQFIPFTAMISKNNPSTI
jgi:hypothetical protein